MVNIRTKGQSGEREVAKMLNEIVTKIRTHLELPQYATQDELFQRNQNQSAVGGSDLTCPMPLEIEVKRQEQLSINTWWKQCVASAQRTGGIPILIFRQSRKKWRIMMFADIPLVSSKEDYYSCLHGVRVEMDEDAFKHWFTVYYGKWAQRND